MQHYVEEVIIHEDYVKGQHHDDVAIIKLTEKVSFRNDVHRVCLPEATQVFPPGEGVVVTGWGSLSYNGESNSGTQQCEHTVILVLHVLSTTSVLYAPFYLWVSNPCRPSLRGHCKDLANCFGLEHSKDASLGVEALSPVETNRKVSGPVMQKGKKMVTLERCF